MAQPLLRRSCLALAAAMLFALVWLVGEHAAVGQGTKKKDNYQNYLNQLRDKFRAWDVNGDNILDKSELAKGFRGPNAKAYDYTPPAKDKSVTTTKTETKVKPYALALACLPRPGLAVNLTLAELLTKPETTTTTTKVKDNPKANPVTQYGDWQLLALIGKNDTISKTDFDNWSKTYAKNLERHDELEREVKASQEKVAKSKGKAKQDAEAALKRHLNDLNNINTQLNAISPQIKSGLAVKK